MSYTNKLLAFFSGNKEAKQHSKKDAQLNYDSSTFFLIGIIITTLAVAIVANTKFKTPNDEICRYSYLFEEEYYGNFTIEKEVEPVKEKEKEVKKEPVKRQPQEQIKIIDDASKENETEIGETDEPVADTPDDSDDNTKGKTDNDLPEDDTNYSFIGVEMVPVFPGCEALSNNNARKECMSNEISKLISKKFDTSITETLNLSGKQSIYVTFIVNKNGQIADVQVRAPHPRLEKEARRVVALIPKLSPGMQNNKPVNVMYSLPIVINVE